MKRRLLVWMLGVCLLFAACAKKNEPAPAPSENVTDETEADTAENQKEPSESQDGEEAKGKESSQEQDAKEETPEEPQQEAEASQEPEVSFVDYSQDIQEEGSGLLLLSVMENCPVISIAGNDAAAEKMNMVFEQQHTSNQTYIEEDTELARNVYKDLSEEEKGSWTGYGYGATYKVAYSSPEILSIICDSYEWQGTPHPNTWSSTYCFDVPTGKLLSLADIFTDKAKAGEIVDQHILDTITSEPYKDYLLEGYESFVSDILREDVFYLNEQGLVVICNPYMVTAYAGGSIEIEVPYEALKDVMNADYIREK